MGDVKEVIRWTAIGLSALIGVAVGWWLNGPDPPWLQFNSISATYERGSRVVKVSGTYTANRECSRREQGTRGDAPDPLVWRQEVEGSGPEVVSYAPRPQAPDLEIGTHTFSTEIPLTEGIDPDGWRVAILASCGSEPLAIRSRSVEVVYIEPGG